MGWDLVWEYQLGKVSGDFREKKISDGMDYNGYSNKSNCVRKRKGTIL